jgi:carbon starvation protein
VFNDYLNAGLCALFVLVVLSMIGFGVVAAWRAYVSPRITAREVVYAT